MRKQKFPKVSVVIPTYNAEKFIVNALDSVLKSDYPNFEIVVVDDVSSDDTPKILEEKYSGHPKIRIFKNKKRLMAAGTRNRGVKLSYGEYIALLDHDIKVDKNWIKEALKVFQRHPDAGTVQGVVLDISRKNLIQHAGIIINAYLGWVISKGFGRTTSEYTPKEEEVFADATGLIFKKTIWENLDGFDESLAINVDDWDFNWRVWLYGYKQYLAPKSITYHWSKKQKVRDKWIKRVDWEFHFAKVPWLFIKNYEFKNILKFLPVYLIINFLRGIFNLVFRLNPAPLLSYFRAIVWIFVNFNTLISQRRVVQKNRKIKDSYLLENLMDSRFITYYFTKYWWPTVGFGKIVSTEEPY